MRSLMRLGCLEGESTTTLSPLPESNVVLRRIADVLPLTHTWQPFQQWMQQRVPSGLLTGAIIALVVQVVAYGLAAAIAMHRLRSRI